MNQIITYFFITFGLITRIIIDVFGLPYDYGLTEVQKKVISTFLSILWPVFYCSLVLFQIHRLYKFLESQFVLPEGHKLYAWNRIALYSTPAALLVVVIILCFRRFL